MAGIFLGLGTCPICSSSKAKFSVSEKTQLPYFVCNACNFQGFARSEHSDMRLRAMVHKSAPAVEEKPAPAVETPAPAAAEQHAPERVEKKEKPTPTGFQWGVLSRG